MMWYGTVQLAKQECEVYACPYASLVQNVHVLCFMQKSVKGGLCEVTGKKNMKAKDGDTDKEGQVYMKRFSFQPHSSFFAFPCQRSWSCSYCRIGSITTCRYLTVIPPGSQTTHTRAWPTAMPSLSFAIITSGLGKSIYTVIVFVGSFYSGNGR